MISLRPAQHTRTDDTIVEVWRNDEMVAVIYPSPEGVKIISKHFDLAKSPEDVVSWELTNPMAVYVDIPKRSI